MPNTSETSNTQDGQSLNTVHDDNVSRDDEREAEVARLAALDVPTEQCGTQKAFIQSKPLFASELADYLDKKNINADTITGQSIQAFIDGKYSKAYSKFCSKNPVTPKASAIDVGHSAINGQRKYDESTRRRQSNKKSYTSKSVAGGESVDAQTAEAPSTAYQGN